MCDALDFVNTYSNVIATMITITSILNTYTVKFIVVEYITSCNTLSILKVFYLFL